MKKVNLSQFVDPKCGLIYLALTALSTRARDTIRIITFPRFAGMIRPRPPRPSSTPSSRPALGATTRFAPLFRFQAPSFFPQAWLPGGYSL